MGDFKCKSCGIQLVLKHEPEKCPICGSTEIVSMEDKCFRCGGVRDDSNSRICSKCKTKPGGE